MKKQLFLSLGLSSILSLLGAQTSTQIIRGSVVDKDTRQPLIGASVVVADLEVTAGAITDYDGKFMLENVPVGRHSIECSYIGYTTWVSDGLVLTSARELVLEIEIKESAVSLGEVVVTAIARPKEAMNDAALLSARSFSVEEVQHFAGAINDPGRMAHSLPGVQPSKDNEGDLIIRGNASSGLLWRLEGVDILNPNHFARLGGSGGGLTIFSVSVLSNSDFFSGAFPSEYGNALAGVFDMRFRNGNQEKRQHTFRAGMLGLEVATEGPFGSNSSSGGSPSKGSGSGSYLLNYRYSTLGILNELGLYLVGDRVRNNFQDLSFNLYFPGKTGKSSVRVWGTGGLSFEEKITSEKAWRVYDDSVSYEKGSDVGILGVTHTLMTGEKSHLKTTIAGMMQRAFYADTWHTAADATRLLNDENYSQGKVALSTFFTNKLTSRTTFKTGLQLSNLFYDLQFDTIQPAGSYFALINEKGSIVQVQPFVQISHRPTARWTLNAGLQAMYFGLTNDFSVEPRLSARVEVTERQSFSLALGLHTQTVPLGVYFAKVQENGTTVQPNLDLDLMKSAQVVLAYDNLLSKQLRLHAEVYVQRLYDIPADFSSGRYFWLLNEIEGYSARRLRSEGKGLNTGLDIYLEKFFRQGLFFILTGSLFESTYDDGDGSGHFNTQFNSNYMAALTTGKEWNFKNSGTLQLGIKMLYVNGLPATPLAAMQPYGERPEFDEKHPFSERIPDYFRPDLRLAWRRGRTSLSLDVQNVLNIKNKRPFGWVFDPDLTQWERRNQANLVPVLGFRVDF
jgi:hypothetical protein